MSEWATAPPGTAHQGCPQEKQKSTLYEEPHQVCAWHQTNKNIGLSQRNLRVPRVPDCDQCQENALEVEIHLQKAKIFWLGWRTTWRHSLSQRILSAEGPLSVISAKENAFQVKIHLQKAKNQVDLKNHMKKIHADILINRGQKTS